MRQSRRRLETTRRQTDVVNLTILYLAVVIIVSCQYKCAKDLLLYDNDNNDDQFDGRDQVYKVDYVVVCK